MSEGAHRRKQFTISYFIHMSFRNKLSTRYKRENQTVDI